MKLVKKYWKPLILSWIIYIALFVILATGGYYGFHLNIVLGIIFFGALTYWFRKKSLDPKEKLIKTILIASPLLFFLIIVILGRMEFYMSPNLIIAQIIGIVLALIYAKVNNLIFKVIIWVFPFMFGIWIYFTGANIWQHYIIYKTFSSGATLKKAPDMNFRKDSVQLTNSDFKGEIAVLYFWDTTCPYTSRYFPALREKSTKWKDNKDVKFYAVNFPCKGDKDGQAAEVLNKWDIGIPNLIGPKAEESYKIFGEFTFPLTIILSPKGDIVFWGAIDRIDKTMEKLLTQSNTQ